MFELQVERKTTINKRHLGNAINKNFHLIYLIDFYFVHTKLKVNDNEVSKSAFTLQSERPRKQR